MGVSRRWFIGGAASFGALQGCRLLSGSSSCGGRPNVTFGVLSDVHLENPGDEDTFLAALAYFHDQGVDGVMIAGDIANHGLYPQLKRAADGWFKVFPDGKARDGRPVAQLWVLGNHDVEGWTWAAAPTRTRRRSVPLPSAMRTTGRACGRSSSTSPTVRSGRRR